MRSDLRPALHAAAAALVVLLFSDSARTIVVFRVRWATESYSTTSALLAGIVVLLLSAGWGWSLAEVRRRVGARRVWLLVALLMVAIVIALAADAIPGVPSAAFARSALLVMIPGTVVLPLFGWRWLMLGLLFTSITNFHYFGLLLVVLGLFGTRGSLTDDIRELWPRRVRE